MNKKLSICFNKIELAESSIQVSKQFKNELIKSGKRNKEGCLCVDFYKFKEIKKTHKNKKISPPTALEMASNFTHAIKRWVSEGFPTVTEVEYKQRAAICNECKYWDGQARLGQGKCNAPGCGCTKLKRWISTEKCPMGKWKTIGDRNK